MTYEWGELQEMSEQELPTLNGQRSEVAILTRNIALRLEQTKLPKGIAVPLKGDKTTADNFRSQMCMNAKKWYGSKFITTKIRKHPKQDGIWIVWVGRGANWSKLP